MICTTAEGDDDEPDATRSAFERLLARIQGDLLHLAEAHRRCLEGVACKRVLPALAGHDQPREQRSSRPGRWNDCVEESHGVAPSDERHECDDDDSGAGDLFKVASFVASREIHQTRRGVAISESVEELECPHNEYTSRVIGTPRSPFSHSQSEASRSTLESVNQFHLRPAWKLSDTSHLQRFSINSNPNYSTQDVSMLEPDEGVDATDTTSQPTLTIQARNRRCLCCHLSSPDSRIRLAWEIEGALFLLIDFFLLPLQVFDIQGSAYLRIIYICIITYWSLDIPATFMVGYYTNTGDLIMDPSRIASQYTRTWLLLDILIVAVDWSSFVVNSSLLAVEDDSLQGLGHLRAARIAKVLRVVRLVRVIRLMKLASKSGVFAVVQEQFDSEYLYVASGLVKYIVVIILTNHLLACLWYYVGTVRVEGYRSWVERYIGDRKDWFYAYLTAYHWSVAQFANGEVLLDPQNIPERIVSIFVLLLSMVVFTAMVALVTQTVASVFQVQDSQMKQRWILRKYLRQHNISWDLKARVNRYVQFILTQHTLADRRDVTLIKYISRPLQVELRTEVFKRHLDVHQFFNLLGQRSLVIMQKLCCRCLDEVLLSRQDFLFSKGESGSCMHFVIKGSLIYTKRGANRLRPTQVRKEDWFGEAVLWTEWITRGTMRAESECELAALNASSLQDTLLMDCIDNVFPKHYAAAFVKVLNARVNDGYPLTDLQHELVQDEAVQKILKVAASHLSVTKALGDYRSQSFLNLNWPFSRAQAKSPEATDSSSDLFPEGVESQEKIHMTEL